MKNNFKCLIFLCILFFCFGCEPFGAGGSPVLVLVQDSPVEGYSNRVKRSYTKLEDGATVVSGKLMFVMDSEFHSLRSGQEVEISQDGYSNISYGYYGSYAKFYYTLDNSFPSVYTSKVYDGHNQKELIDPLEFGENATYKIMVIAKSGRKESKVSIFNIKCKLHNNPDDSGDDGDTSGSNIAGNLKGFSLDDYSFKMVYVPPKRFPTGVLDNGSDQVDSDYYIGRTEVTKKMFIYSANWAKDHGYQFVETVPSLPADPSDVNLMLPHKFLWRDAMVWCNAFTQYYNEINGTNLTPVYYTDYSFTKLQKIASPSLSINMSDPGSNDQPFINTEADGFRMPRLVEWQLAARYRGDFNDDGDIADVSEYYPGNYFSGANSDYRNVSAAPYISWYLKNSSGKLNLAGTAGSVNPYQPLTGNTNDLGLYDMSGNLAEWCFDWALSKNGTHRCLVGGDYSWSYLHTNNYNNDNPSPKSPFLVGNVDYAKPNVNSISNIYASQGYRIEEVPSIGTHRYQPGLRIVKNVESVDVDTTSPSSVSDLSYTKNGNSLVVSWTDPQDSDLDYVGIEVVPNTKTQQWVAVGVETYTFSNYFVTNDAVESLRVVSVDICGNKAVSDLQVADINVSQAGGTYTSDVTTVITCATAGVSLRYALDDEELSESSGTLISSGDSVVIDKSCTLKVLAYKDGHLSKTRSEDYAMEVADLSINHAGRAYANDVTVVINCSTAGASIRYTTDDIELSESSGTLISSGESIVIDKSCTLKVLAYKDGYLSKTRSEDYVLFSKICASDGAPNDYFGNSVSISGDRAIVGARQDDDKGSVYIYERQADGSWTEEKIVASDGAAADCFGSSVSIDGDRAIVGAYLDDEKGSNSGSAYIYEQQADGSWTEEKIVASDGANSDFFGHTVAISGDRAIVGAYRDDDKGSDSGSVYIYERQVDGSWTEEKIVASDGAAVDYFGYTVAISGDRAIVGASRDDDKGSDSGSVYIYECQVDGSWTEENIIASDGAASDLFGSSVSIDGDRAIVGACYDDDKGSDSGSAYIYERQADGSWTEEKIVALDGSTSDNFGYSVSISGDRAIVGAYYDDDKGSNSGSVYPYESQADGSWGLFLK